jgi:dTDP-4-dehydrorhamnose reductase
MTKIDCKVNSITTDEYPTLANRPKDSVMNKGKIMKEFDMEILNWKNSLGTCITTLKKQ